MSINIYLDNNKFITLKATNYNELIANFKGSLNAIDANFYTFHNKKVGALVLSDFDLEGSKGILYATDIGCQTHEVEEVFCKDTRNKKYKYEDARNDGKSRNKLTQLKIQKITLKKTLHELQNLRDKKNKAQAKEDKNIKRYTDKEVKRDGRETLDDNVKEILLIENQLHKFAMDMLRRNQKKFLMKTTRSNVVV
jgi:hypothetical protein